jgi:hypothetical protein
MRVGKNKALVKDMFFNAEDVNWFKPVDVWIFLSCRLRKLSFAF